MERVQIFHRRPLAAAMIVLITIGSGITSCRGGGKKVSALAPNDYGAMAKLNWSGVRGGAGRSEATPISTALEGAYSVEDNKAVPKCDPDSSKKFQLVVQQYPAFPFAHYGLASCLRRGGDAAWKGHATAAVGIFEKTTAIPGHHKSHDQVLAKLREWLARDQTRPVLH